MLSVLRQPYAVLEPAPAQIRGAGFIGLFIGIFLLVFQPFGLSQWETDYKWLKIGAFGLITFIFTAIHFTLWPVLFPRYFSEQRWTVGKAIWFVLLNILLIAIGNFLYLGFLLNVPFSWGSLIWMIFITLLVGLFPAAGSVVTNYIRRLHQYRDSAAKLHLSAPLSVTTNSVAGSSPTSGFASTESVPLLTLIADNEKDKLVLAPVDLLYIESSDNYCTVYYLQQDKLQKPLLRSSLSRMEAQLTQQPRLVRCHRSFIVNLDRVERVTGNAQGYKLHLMGGQLEVPVARRYNDTLIAGLQMG